MRTSGAVARRGDAAALSALELDDVTYEQIVDASHEEFEKTLLQEFS